MRTYLGVALIAGLAWLLGSSMTSDFGLVMASVGRIFFFLCMGMVGWHLIRGGREDGMRQSHRQ